MNDALELVDNSLFSKKTGEGEVQLTFNGFSSG